MKKYNYITVATTYQGKKEYGEILDNAVFFGKYKSHMEYTDWGSDIYIDVLHIEELPKKMNEDEINEYIENNWNRLKQYFNLNNEN